MKQRKIEKFDGRRFSASAAYTPLSSCPNSFRIIAAQRHEHCRRRVNKARSCKCRLARTREIFKRTTRRARRTKRAAVHPLFDRGTP